MENTNIRNTSNKTLANAKTLRIMNPFYHNKLSQMPLTAYRSTETATLPN